MRNRSDPLQEIRPENFVHSINSGQSSKTGNSIILIVCFAVFTQECGRILLFMKNICGIIAVLGG
jgi:hypothetical protein